jgi:glutamate racemase
MQNKYLKLDKNWPIGIFDSGLGGLTVVPEIKKSLPGEDLIYVADNKYLPYGDRSRDEIIIRSETIARFLTAYPVKALVIACNTATAASIRSLREKFQLPIIGVEPGIKPACEITQTGNIGVLATAGTLGSEKYENLRNLHGKDVKVIEQACQGLVHAIEKEYPDFNETRKLLKLYLDPFISNQVDTVVLGCTHYPLIEKLVHDEMHTVVTINTGAAIARQLKKRLKEINLLNPKLHDASLDILASRADVNFQNKILRLRPATAPSGDKLIQLPAHYC